MTKAAVYALRCVSRVQVQCFPEKRAWCFGHQIGDCVGLVSMRVYCTSWLLSNCQTRSWNWKLTEKVILIQYMLLLSTLGRWRLCPLLLGWYVYSSLLFSNWNVDVFLFSSSYVAGSVLWFSLCLLKSCASTTLVRPAVWCMLLYCLLISEAFRLSCLWCYLVRSLHVVCCLMTLIMMSLARTVW